MKILITGGAGFIGSHLVRLIVNKYPNYTVHNLDKLTYAGNLANLTDIENKPNYKFIKGDIVDAKFINDLFEKEEYNAVIHLAAESHVDRSITNPLEFVNLALVVMILDNLCVGFYDFHYFNSSCVEFYDFHDFHNYQMEF